MFRFKSATDCLIFISLSLFQYILCFGSSGLIVKEWSFKMNVSIHPMFRFKQMKDKWITLDDAEHCFNTSYVSVQDSYSEKNRKLSDGFNTSYVSVQGR